MNNILLVVISLIFFVFIPFQSQSNELLLGTGDVSSEVTVLYRADSAMLESVNPMEVKMIVSKGCFFTREPTNFASAGKTLEELFNEALGVDKVIERGNKEKILHILRIIDFEKKGCASIWFTYVDQ